MWQFTMIEPMQMKDSLAKVAEQYEVTLEHNSKETIIKFNHVFSHLKWHIDSYLVDAVKRMQIRKIQYFLQMSKLPIYQCLFRC